MSTSMKHPRRRSWKLKTVRPRSKKWDSLSKVALHYTQQPNTLGPLGRRIATLSALDPLQKVNYPLAGKN